MLVSVMDIRIVRMYVFKTIMLMRVGMRLTGRIACLMLMLMVFVMNVPVIVPHELVNVRMFMSFGKVQP
jgi:hypothetical protein